MRATYGKTFPLPAAQLIERFRSLSCQATVVAFAQIAAVLAQRDEGLGSKFLLNEFIGPLVAEPRVAAYLGRTTGYLANEAVVYFCQAMALLYGQESGRPPTSRDVAFLMFFSNDYCFEWAELPSVELTARERMVAESVRQSLMNRGTHLLQDLVRGVRMLEEPPPRSPDWQDAAKWQAFQSTALGMTLREYALAGAGALFMMSATWGQAGPDGLRRSPVFDRSAAPKSKTAPHAIDEVLDRLSIGRDEAGDLLTKDLGTDGLPVGITIFYRKPLLRFGRETLVASSPWMVHAHMFYGLWARHLEESKKRDRRYGAEKWFAAFGDIFESWCRSIASKAYASATATKDRLVLSESIGSPDEIADIVIVSTRDIVLFSVKSRFLPEPLVKRARSRKEVLDWYNEVLFAGRAVGKDGHEHREGAVRALDRTAKAIAAGKYAGLDPRARVYPVIVTYDDLSGDNLATNSWIQNRSREEELLQGSRERPVTVIDVRTFEHLMALASRGTSVPRLLNEKTSAKWRLEKVDVLFAHKGFTLGQLRLPHLDAQFGELTDALADDLGFRNPALSKSKA